MTNNGFTGRKVKASGEEALAGCLALIVLVPIIVALSAVFTLLAWNFGVVALVAAAGGSVGKIGFFTAICVNFALGIIGTMIRGPKVK